MTTAIALPSELETLVSMVVAGFGPALGLASSASLPDANRQAVIARLALATGYRYAPDAPTEAHVEAATRMGGHLLGAPAHIASRAIGDPSGTTVDVAYLNAGASHAFRRSGARVLLSPWRIRRMT